MATRRGYWFDHAWREFALRSKSEFVVKEALVTFYDVMRQKWYQRTAFSHTQVTRALTLALTLTRHSSPYPRYTTHLLSHDEGPEEGLHCVNQPFVARTSGVRPHHITNHFDTPAGGDEDRG